MIRLLHARSLNGLPPRTAISIIAIDHMAAVSRQPYVELAIHNFAVQAADPAMGGASGPVMWEAFERRGK